MSNARAAASDPRRPFKIATCSLAGCFGCHMSLLDIDERLQQLAELAEFSCSPFTDLKTCEPCDLGLVEGGVCNTHNLDTLQTFRQHCTVLVAVGACALNGGVPALRNRYSLQACLEEAYVKGPGIVSPGIPDDPELPLLLDQVYPVHEVVRIDYVLPGCPPPAEAFWELLSALIAGREPRLEYRLRRFD